MNEEEIRDKYGITKKQYDFANHILKGDNPTTAYRKAYDTQADGRSVSSQAGKTLRNPKVAAYIRDMQRMSYEQARSENRNIMDTVEIMEWWSSVITSQSRSIKMADRIKCSELLAKASNMFVQKIEADVTSINDIVINITGDSEDEEE